MFENLQRAEQGDAGMQQVGKLRIEYGEMPTGDFLSDPSPQTSFGLRKDDLRGKQRATGKRADHLVLVCRAEQAAHFTPGEFTGFVLKVRHRSLNSIEETSLKRRNGLRFRRNTRSFRSL